MRLVLAKSALARRPLPSSALSRCPLTSSALSRSLLIKSALSRSLLIKSALARSLLATSALVLTGVLFSSAALAAPTTADVIERGRVLAIAGDCASCHTVAGGAPYAGGRAIETPFGNVIAPNITPDNETGIGAWSDDEFLRAMQTGIGKDGAYLFPAFPYPYYTHVARGDLVAIRAFLNTLEPVRNAVDGNQLRFPYNIRALMNVWNGMFFNPGVFQPVAAKSAEWNRGAYLVEGLGHCAACHTSKTMLGGDSSAALQGGEVEDWLAPSLNGDRRTGLGDWSVDDVVAYLHAGNNAHSSASGPMGEVVALSTSKLPMADLHAIAVYLKDLPTSGAVSPAPIAASDAGMQAGAAIYQDNCEACHTSNGTGVPHLFPALAGNAIVQSTDPVTLVRVVLQGARAIDTDAAPTGPTMPGFGWKLTDAQVASVLTYVRNDWGNAAPPVTASDVAKLRTDLDQRAGQ